MGKRSRKRDGRAGGLEHPSPDLAAPVSDYADGEGNLLELRGSLTLKARAEYAATLHGGLNQDDAAQRALELLFERLAVAWTVNAVRTDRQGELLARYRVASADERRFVRDSLRSHAAEWFPDVEVP
jgi:hypothetical protein